MTLYNPHLLPRHDLIETFVARQPLLDELLDDLRRGGKQHHLLVGNRGSGKTTLLLRLAAAIEDDQKLVKKCIPLRFPEEQYNVNRPSDFWMNVIDALVDALERQEDRASAKRLEAALAELEPLEEDERAKRSLALLEGWAKQARRLIVLLVDNVDLVLERLSASLWALREALSIDNRLVVIGASSKFIEEAIDYQSPLYDFFRVHELGPLEEDEARRLVLSLAQRALTPRVAEVLEHDPGRFKALFVLTGGTPRTLALLHTVLALEHSDRIERDLEGLLDQLTPYYKARFDDLPSQSQLIVDKVALHWHPITAAECQAATHLDLNAVSAQLSRLVKGGLLTKVSLPGANKLGFQLSERFFNIWYLMRASRRLRRRLSWFVEFLRIFYGEEDLRRRAEELVRAEPKGSLDSPARFLAFASAVPDETLRRRLEFRAIGLLMENGIAAMRELMDLDGEDVHLAPIIDRVHTLREIRTRISNSTFMSTSGVSSRCAADTIAGHPWLTLRLKQIISSTISRDRYTKIETFLDRSTYGLTFGQRLLDAIASGELPSALDITAAEIRPFVELADNKAEVIFHIIFWNELSGTPLTDGMLRELLHPSGVAIHGIVATAIWLIGRGNWIRARQLLLPFLSYAGVSAQLGMFLILFSTCVAENRASEVTDLLVESGLAERWAPLYEALRAIIDDSQLRLDALAPEVRTPALQLFTILIGYKKKKNNELFTDIDTSAPKMPGPRRTPRSRGEAKRARPPRPIGIGTPRLKARGSDGLGHPKAPGLSALPKRR